MGLEIYQILTVFMLMTAFTVWALVALWVGGKVMDRTGSPGLATVAALYLTIGGVFVAFVVLLWVD